MPSTTTWGRSLAASIVKHLPDVEDEVLRNRPVSAYLKDRGRFLFNQGGNGFDWRIKYKLHTVQGNTGETARNFTRTNRYQIAELEYRGYQVVDAIYKKEMLENRGPEQIIDLAGDMVEDLTESLDEHIGDQWYVDGNLAGNENSLHGFESMMGIDGTLHATTGAARGSSNAADLYGWASDTYANLTTGLGDYGGSQTSGIWPDGQAQPAFDFFTPVVLNYQSTVLGGTAQTWAVQCIEAIRALQITVHRNGGQNNAADFGVLDRSLYRDMLNALDDKERVLVTNDAGLRSFGFKNVVEIDGVEWTHDYGVPVDVGYVFNVDQMDVRSMQATFLNSDENEWDIDSQSMKYVVDCLANLKFKSPRNFGKLQGIA